MRKYKIFISESFKTEFGNKIQREEHYRIIDIENDDVNIVKNAVKNELINFITDRGLEITDFKFTPIKNGKIILATVRKYLLHHNIRASLVEIIEKYPLIFAHNIAIHGRIRFDNFTSRSFKDPRSNKDFTVCNDENELINAYNDHIREMNKIIKEDKLAENTVGLHEFENNYGFKKYINETEGKRVEYFFEFKIMSLNEYMELTL